MAACYTADASFSDPVFRDLKGDEPGAMWRMLTGRADDLSVELVEHDADDETGTAHWLASYTFTQTGRHVDNDVRASFRFRDGLIAEHRDQFGFHRWARQALGPTGLLLGWAPPLQGSVRGRARKGLDEFMAGEGKDSSGARA
jgi:ketosteroid isomerase-like protein